MSVIRFRTLVVVNEQNPFEFFPGLLFCRQNAVATKRIQVVISLHLKYFKIFCCTSVICCKTSFFSRFGFVEIFLWVTRYVLEVNLFLQKPIQKLAVLHVTCTMCIL